MLAHARLRRLDARDERLAPMLRLSERSEDGAAGGGGGAATVAARTAAVSRFDGRGAPSARPAAAPRRPRRPCMKRSMRATISAWSSFARAGMRPRTARMGSETTAWVTWP